MMSLPCEGPVPQFLYKQSGCVGLTGHSGTVSSNLLAYDNNNDMLLRNISFFLFCSLLCHGDKTEFFETKTC